MSRTELFNFDRGLYEALKRTKQLDLAVPIRDNRGRGKRESTPQFVIDDIIKSFSEGKINQKQLSYQLSGTSQLINGGYRRPFLILIDEKTKQVDVKY